MHDLLWYSRLSFKYLHVMNHKILQHISYIWMVQVEKMVSLNLHVKMFGNRFLPFLGHHYGPRIEVLNHKSETWNLMFIVHYLFTLRKIGWNSSGFRAQKTTKLKLGTSNYAVSVMVPTNLFKNSKLQNFAPKKLNFLTCSF